MTNGLIWKFLIFTLIISLIPVSAFSAENQRTALVIGNGAYKTGPLKNPTNDAKDMAAALRKLGFDVIERLNADKRAMVLAVDEFYTKLRRSEVGLFYFAGHGIQIQGVNYLIPVESHVTSATDIQFEAMDAGRVLGKMKSAGNKLNIVILDACRNNPFKRSFRTEYAGLAQMDAPKGTVIAYATAPGSVAADGAGRNGIYTSHLLENLRKPELSLQEMFMETGLGVMHTTGDIQVPWISSTPIPRYYLARGAALVDRPSATGTEPRLKIECNVSGASVLLDGRPLGVTPLKDVSVSEGKHRVRVDKEGYKPYERQIDFTPGRSQSLNIHLDSSEPPKGRLYVETKPSDALVKVLNIEPRFRQGMELEAGSYELEMSAEGYETQRKEVSLSAGENKRVSFVLSSVLTQPAAGGMWQEPLTGMEFVQVPGGCYEMGCGSWQINCYSDEKPAHMVCLDSFYIGKYEVTQGQWEKVMGSDSSYYKKGGNYPVEKVPWDDAKRFIEELHRRSGGRHKFRLPTEAEWEYACRSGGKREIYAGGWSADKFAWHYTNSGKKTHPIGRKHPNGLGIYDMSGNVYEWCEDMFAENAYSEHARNNPIYEGRRPIRVIRGGSNHYYPRHARCSSRSRNTHHGMTSVGFRLVMTE